MSQSQRIPILIWLVTLLLAVPLGILPGILVVQDQYVWALAIFGWSTILPILFRIVTNDHSLDPRLLLVLGYLLAMFVYGPCSYWAIRRVGAKRKGLLVVAVAAFVSALISIPVAVITPHEGQVMNTDFLHALIDYLPVCVIHVFILINLLISALLGWLIAVGLIRLRKRYTLAVV